MDPPYELLSATRYERTLEKQSWNRDAGEPSPFLILSYHHERLHQAAQDHARDHYCWRQALGAFPSYSAFKAAAYNAVSSAAQPSDAYKVRFTLSHSGTLRVSATPIAPLTGATKDPTAAAFFKPSDSGKQYGTIFDVRIDTQPTPPSIFTSTKTTHRTHYDDARARAGLGPLPISDQPSEVILYNTSGYLTEGSISNVAFYDARTSSWHTPRASTGCLPGSLRRWLLEEKRIREADRDFTADEFENGTWVLLINSVLGCRVGRIQKH